MTLPNRIAAYDDCFEVFARAPVRVKFEDYGTAKMFVMRLHQARALQRAEAQRMYDREDSRWGKSEYDRFVVRHPLEDTEGAWWIYVETHGSNILAIEELEFYPLALEDPNASGNSR